MTSDTTSETEQKIADTLARLHRTDDLAGVEAIRVEALGKQGWLNQLMKTLGKMSPEARQVEGPRLQGMRTRISEALDDRKAALEAAELERRLATETLDLTLPAPAMPTGSVHPVSQVMDELAEIFADLGFSVATGPEIEDDWHNFTALNMAETHPARAMHDTFYFGEQDRDAEGNRMLLRPHPSPVQIRAMVEQGAPIRLIAPGRVYRSDSDATHTPMFHQIEGLVIDKNIHMGHLKGCLIDFIKAYFELDDFPVRLRPHYFPFTEPSAEMDIGCDRSGGKLVMGQGDDWLEILGCGMVHPNVLKNCGIDPEEYQGFAFGAGLDRLAMLKYGIPDLRTFFEPDQRWLQHYSFGPYDQPNKTFKG